MKTLIRNVATLAIILLIVPFCAIPLSALWHPVFDRCLELPYELTIVMVEVPYAFTYFVGGVLAGFLVHGTRKHLWLLAAALVGSVSAVSRSWISPDASVYKQAVFYTVASVCPWFLLLGNAAVARARRETPEQDAGGYR